MPWPDFIRLASRRDSAPTRFGVSAVLCLALLATGCAPREAPVYEEQAYVFGTLVEIKIAGEPESRARELAGHVFREFGRLHGKLHAWKPGPLETINEAFAQGKPAAVDEELAAIIRDAARHAQRSRDLFNPAIGKLVRLWGFHAEEFAARLPDRADIEGMVSARPSLSDVVLDRETVSSRNPAVRLDFGGYAKGYALDLASRYLREQGVKSALINIGGNVLAVGSRGPRPWRIGIQHPRQPSAVAALELRDGEAVGTSGDYQRYFILDGQRYCHVIDPRTGFPARGVQAATVVIPPGPEAGTLSDVATKPLFIAGRDGWREAAQAMGVEQALLIDGEGTIHVTRALAQRLQVLDKAAKLREIP
jgi:thiamine biosynthesis lipoprotein